MVIFINIMKKSSKIIVWTSAAVVVLATVGTLLGVFIPQWLNNSKLTNLVKNQVKPTEGNGNYLQYSLKNAVDSSAGQLQSIEEFVKKSLTTEEVALNVNENIISNYLTQLFKNFKSSDSYANRYKTWNEEINDQWDELVKSYKSQHGNLWEFYFQTEVLDQAGGNEDDWKRAKLFANVNTAFDSLLFQDLHISALRNGTPIDVTTSPTAQLQKYLFSADLVNGATAGARNNIVFRPSTIDSSTSSYTNAIANFQEFIFNEYVKNTLPVVTSMVLFKHIAPQTEGVSSFFNVAKAKEIYDVNNAADVVGTDASYTWQVFPAAQTISGSPEGTEVWNATDKYLNFVKNNSKFVLGDIGGAINIPVTSYTDDSATLYYVKLADVFGSSYAQYSAAATYKFNVDVLGHTADANVPTTTAFKNTPFSGTFGTEIMSNFMTNGTAKTGYVQFPQQVKDIINNSGAWTGNYNGMTQIADSVNVTNSPFILTRDEAGVHVIGIDRYDAIKAATTEDGKLNELKNTILWRHILTEFGLGKTTGFSVDLQTELKTYYDTNKNQLLYQYILANENDPSAVDSNSYLFSSTFTDVSSLGKLSDGIYNDYINAWIDYKKYQTKLAHKTTVTEKILALQTNYTSKIYGNSVIQNGIAGVLPYTRQTTADAKPSINNDGIYNLTYGTYPTLGFYQNLTATGTIYSEVDAQTQLNNIKTTLIDNLYASLVAENISYKKLTYPSAKYNQYLLIGTTSEIKSNNEFMSNGDVVNAAVTKWISAANAKNIVIIEKMISDINYNNASGQTKVFDEQSWSLGGTYSVAGDGTTSMTAAPTSIPTMGDTASITSYMNYYLQQAYETKKIVPNYLSELSTIMQDGWTSADIRTIARNRYFSNLLKNAESADALTYLKDLAALKSALDYNPTTNNYDLTKFRDYLLDQTSNFKKAAFVWNTKDKIDLFGSAYADATAGIKDHYSFKPYNITKNAGVYGYAYQGANSIATYKNSDNTWKKTSTFNDTNEYFDYIKLGNATTDLAFTGYLGMQFENETSANLNSKIKTSLFSGSLNVYDGYNVQTAIEAPKLDQVNIKGVLYNIGSRSDFVASIRELIFNWSQVNSLANWLNNVFAIPISDISRTDLNLAKSQLIDIVNKQENGLYVLPDEVFERNEKALLVNNEYSVVQPETGRLPFYFASASDETNPYYSTAVFTQFNNKDVIELFDTNADETIDSQDSGINWTVAAGSDQFLGASAEAFFTAAMNWYTNQTALTSTAYDNALERQGKVLVYDRRLNDQFGEDLVANYKKTPSTESD